MGQCILVVMATVDGEFIIIPKRDNLQEAGLNISVTSAAFLTI